MRHPIPSAALDDRLGFIGTSGSGKTYNAGTAVEMLLARKNRVVIIDPLGVWWGLRLLADGKKASNFEVAIFGGPHGDLALTENAGALIGETAATTAESCIIDLSELASKAADRRFMLAFLEAIYAKASGEPFHLVVDEADLFAPQKPMRPGDEMLLHHMEQIVRRGRVKGFIPWVISQRPAILNKNVLSQVDGLLAFKLTSTQDRDAIDAWIEGQADKAHGKAIKDSLPTLKIGQGVVWLPSRGILDTASFPEKVTFDSSRTPKRGEKLKRTATLKPLDLGRLKEKLATVETEAKANDPKALRASIAKLQSEKATLEKQVAAAASAAPDPEVIAKAEERGFDKAQKQLTRASEKAVRTAMLDFFKSLREKLHPLDAFLAESEKAARTMPVDLSADVKFTPSPRISPVPTGNGTTQRRSAAPPPPRPPSAKTVTVASGDGSFTRPQTKVLESLAMWRSLGHDAPSREMVAAVAGYSPSSGGFNNLLGSLKAPGYIDYPRPGYVSLQVDGVVVMSKEDGRNLLLSTLSNPQKKIVGALIDQGTRSREEVGADTSYSPSSGGFNNLLGSLRTVGIIDYPQPGSVMMTDWAQELLTGCAERLAA